MSKHDMQKLLDTLEAARDALEMSVTDIELNEARANIRASIWTVKHCLRAVAAV
ncbi:hypothetical protein AWB76_03258 [Caballeronia temeraria]|uniref:Uncharacterized protein n=1 Tax=Caballeronia temeraria TaxID=1777137 RepID=A0A158AX19_9BURK|nr:hypothetical protein [Caballeronia temeraria]SAK62508.1 hypothetical protein AWB76_03258 [Caballeronia temeraria]